MDPWYRARLSTVKPDNCRLGHGGPLAAAWREPDRATTGIAPTWTSVGGPGGLAGLGGQAGPPRHGGLRWPSLL